MPGTFLGLLQIQQNYLLCIHFLLAGHFNDLHVPCPPVFSNMVRNLFGHKVLSEETYLAAVPHLLSRKSTHPEPWLCGALPAVWVWRSLQSWAWPEGLALVLQQGPWEARVQRWAGLRPHLWVPGWESGGRSLTWGLVSPPEKWDRRLSRSVLGTRWDDAPRGPGSECSRHSSSFLNEASFTVPQRGLTDAWELHRPASWKSEQLLPSPQETATGHHRGPASHL